MERANVVVIGAGVVGLAVSAELSAAGKDLFLLEQHESFGRETSSRNSEVIHAGLYYEPDSLKARLCVEGNRLLYDYCEKNAIPHRRLGKMVVAKNDAELEDLERILRRGLENGVQGVRYLTRKELDAYAPRLSGKAAILSPATGIVDSHSLMKRLEFEAERNGALISYNTRVTGIQKGNDGYRLEVMDADGETLEIGAQVVVNCAGIGADQIAAMAGIDLDACGYRVRYWKGEYFSVSNQRALVADRLVYPVKGFAVGIHTVVDLQGQVKLGPKLYPMEQQVIDYQMDGRHGEEFFEACSALFPQLRPQDLAPDMAGISPALAGPVDDWAICHETQRGYSGFVNLIGMKSPALTSCLAIARHVKTLLAC